MKDIESCPEVEIKTRERIVQFKTGNFQNGVKRSS